MSERTLLYWSRNPGLGGEFRRRGWPMEPVTMLHRADLLREGKIDPTLVWPHAQRVNGQDGVGIINLEHTITHTGPDCPDEVHYDPRAGRSTEAQVRRTVQLVADVMFPFSLLAPSVLRTVTLSCLLPYFRTGVGGEAEWRRSVDRLVDWGMFADQTAHFFDVWAGDRDPGGAWLISKGDAPADEGVFDQNVRLSSALPEMPVICQWAPVTRNGHRMHPGVLARNLTHHWAKAPGVRAFLWISGMLDAAGTMVDYPEGSPERAYLLVELERCFASGGASVVVDAAAKGVVESV